MMAAYFKVVKNQPLLIALWTMAIASRLSGAVILDKTMYIQCPLTVIPTPNSDTSDPEVEVPMLKEVSLSGCQTSKECKLDNEYTYKLEFIFEPNVTLPAKNATFMVSTGRWTQSKEASALESGKNTTEFMYINLAHLDNATTHLEVNVASGPFNFCFRLIKLIIYTKALIASEDNDAWKTGDTCKTAGVPCNFKHSYCKQVDNDKEHHCKCNPNMVEYEGRCLVKPGEFCFSSEECVENAICNYDKLTCECAPKTTLNATEGTCSGAAGPHASFGLAVVMVLVALVKLMF